MLPDWWERHFLFWEFALAVAVASSFAGHVFLDNGADIYECVLHGRRTEIYGIVIGSSVALLAMMVTFMSIVLVWIELPRLELLRDSGAYPILWKVFAQTTAAIGLLVGIGLIGLLVDTDGNQVWGVTTAVLFVLLFAGFRMARTIWAFLLLVRILTAREQAKK